MSDRKETIEQTKLAFNLIQKLYLEVSYFIKEVEGLLQDEEEKFIIGKPGGYQVSARSSLGLESPSVNLWFFRKLAVFFGDEGRTVRHGGVTITSIDENLKVIYLRIVLDDKDLKEPQVYIGVLYDIAKKPEAKTIKKFEHFMGHMQGRDDKIFRHPTRIDYEDVHIRLKGDFIRNNLFEINNSDAILKRIVEPALQLYRKH